MLVYEKYSEMVEVKYNYVFCKLVFMRKYIFKLFLKYLYLGKFYIYFDVIVYVKEFRNCFLGIDIRIDVRSKVKFRFMF